LNFDNLRRVYGSGHVAVDNVNLSARGVGFDGRDVCVHDVAGIKSDADERAYAVVHVISILLGPNRGVELRVLLQPFSSLENAEQFERLPLLLVNPRLRDSQVGSRNGHTGDLDDSWNGSDYELCSWLRLSRNGSNISVW
jgi:hypothetical protein